MASGINKLVSGTI